MAQISIYYNSDDYDDYDDDDGDDDDELLSNVPGQLGMIYDRDK